MGLSFSVFSPGWKSFVRHHLLISANGIVISEGASYTPELDHQSSWSHSTDPATILGDLHPVQTIQPWPWSVFTELESQGRRCGDRSMSGSEQQLFLLPVGVSQSKPPAASAQQGHHTWPRPCTELSFMLSITPDLTPAQHWASCWASHLATPLHNTELHAEHHTWPRPCTELSFMMSITPGHTPAQHWASSIHTPAPLPSTDRP
jgi:hypothetical protein